MAFTKAKTLVLGVERKEKKQGSEREDLFHIRLQVNQVSPESKL